VADEWEWLNNRGCLAGAGRDKVQGWLVGTGRLFATSISPSVPDFQYSYVYVYTVIIIIGHKWANFSR